MEMIGINIAYLNFILGKYLPGWRELCFYAQIFFMAIRWARQNAAKQIKQKAGSSIWIWLNSFGRSLYFLLQALLLQIVLLAVLYYSYFSIIRWAEVCIGICVLIYMVSKRTSGLRGLHTCVGHLGILLISWVYGGWLGLFFYIGSLVRDILLLDILPCAGCCPASDPDDFKSLCKDLDVGVVFMGIAVSNLGDNEDTDRISEERIRGGFFKAWHTRYDLGAISSGSWNNIRDAIFPRRWSGRDLYAPYERPYEIIDLRPQIRTSMIEAISQDGIPYQARLLVVFSIDKDVWGDDEYSELRHKNRLLRGAQKPDRNGGNYRYSRSRVTATLSIESVQHSMHDAENQPIYWDQWVLAMAEEAARKELSIYPLNELWRPVKDKQDLNPLDAISEKIKDNTSRQLKIHGINLIAARIVNFQFDSDESKAIAQRQIDNWRSYIEQDISQTQSNADAQLVNIKESAAAYARSNLLASIVDGLDAIGDTYPNLPKKYVIAMQLIKALEDALHQHPQTEDRSEEFNKLEAYRQFLRNNNFPSQGSK